MPSETPIITVKLVKYTFGGEHSEVVRVETVSTQEQIDAGYREVQELNEAAGPFTYYRRLLVA